jgi:hypothetical protein
MVSGRKEKPEARFWDKVDRGDEDECWEWVASKTSGGYGNFYLGESSISAHRFAYKQEEQPPGDNLVLHTCDNPSCVNPSHLYLGDQQDNMNDAVERGRIAEGEDHGMTSLTAEQVSHLKWEGENTGKTNTVLADEYGVTVRTIGNILRGVTWSDVEPEKP